MGHATVEITAESFKELVEKPGILFLDFWAAWCGPCRTFGPIFEEAASKNPDLVCGKVDTEKEQALAGTFQIRSIPTLMIFRDGVLLFSQPGMLPAEALAELVTKVKELDMDAVKADIARRKEEEETPGAAAAEES